MNSFTVLFTMRSNTSLFDLWFVLFMSDKYFPNKFALSIGLEMTKLLLIVGHLLTFIPEFMTKFLFSFGTFRLAIVSLFLVLKMAFNAGKILSSPCGLILLILLYQ